MIICWSLTLLKHLRLYRDLSSCSSGTLTNVLPHRNVMPQTQYMTPKPATAYRHRADLSLCYPLIWNVTLEYPTTHYNVLNPGPVVCKFITLSAGPQLLFSYTQRVSVTLAITVCPSSSLA